MIFKNHIIWEVKRFFFFNSTNELINKRNYYSRIRIVSWQGSWKKRSVRIKSLILLSRVFLRGGLALIAWNGTRMSREIEKSNWDPATQRIDPYLPFVRRLCFLRIRTNRPTFTARFADYFFALRRYRYRSHPQLFLLHSCTVIIHELILVIESII